MTAVVDGWTDRVRFRLEHVLGGYVTVFVRRVINGVWQWGWWISVPGHAAAGRQCGSGEAAPTRYHAIDAAILDLRKRWQDVPAVWTSLQAILDRWE